MGRRAEPFTLVHRHGSPYTYFKLDAGKRYRSSGTTVKAEALKIAIGIAGADLRPLEINHNADLYSESAGCVSDELDAAGGA